MALARYDEHDEAFVKPLVSSTAKCCANPCTALFTYNDSLRVFGVRSSHKTDGGGKPEICGGGGGRGVFPLPLCAGVI